MPAHGPRPCQETQTDICGDHIDRLLNQNEEYPKCIRVLFKWTPALVLLLVCLLCLLWLQPWADAELMKVRFGLQQCHNDLEVSEHDLLGLKRNTAKNNSRLAEILAQRDASAAAVQQCEASLAAEQKKRAEGEAREETATKQTKQCVASLEAGKHVQSP